MRSRRWILAVLLIIGAASASGAEEVIREGAGWGQLLVNSPAAAVAQGLKGERYLIQLPSQDVECLVNEEGTIVEVRFNKNFKGATTKGIRIGSSEEDLEKAYGKPSKVENSGNARKLIYNGIGMLFWITDNKVNQIVVPIIR